MVTNTRGRGYILSRDTGFQVTGNEHRYPLVLWECMGGAWTDCRGRIHCRNRSNSTAAYSWKVDLYKGDSAVTPWQSLPFGSGLPWYNLNIDLGRTGRPTVNSKFRWIFSKRSPGDSCSVSGIVCCADYRWMWCDVMSSKHYGVTVFRYSHIQIQSANALCVSFLHSILGCTEQNISSSLQLLFCCV